MVAAIFLCLALTRAEIIERFKAPVITKASGFVQVIADCPKDMRQEYQIPVASFAADICKKLAAAEGRQSSRYADPGVVVYVGEERTNRTDVIVRKIDRKDGSKYTRIYLPAPEYSDVDKFRLEVVRAFYFAVNGEEYDDREVYEAMINADPVLKANEQYEKLSRWQRGEETGDDEDYLKLARSIIVPGTARQTDVLRFASRLKLYPNSFSAPFARKYHELSFSDAVKLADVEPRIRLAAYEKAPLAIAYGGGRSEELLAAAEAYSAFLFDLARFEKSKKELLDQLCEADVKLEIALEQAREYEKEQAKTWR